VGDTQTNELFVDNRVRTKQHPLGNVKLYVFLWVDRRIKFYPPGLFKSTLFCLWGLVRIQVSEYGFHVFLCKRRVYDFQGPGRCRIVEIVSIAVFQCGKIRQRDMRNCP